VIDCTCLCMCPTYNCTKNESEFTCSSTNFHILYFQCYIIKILALWFIKIPLCKFYTINIKMSIYVICALYFNGIESQQKDICTSSNTYTSTTVLVSVNYSFTGNHCLKMFLLQIKCLQLVMSGILEVVDRYVYNLAGCL